MKPINKMYLFKRKSNIPGELWTPMHTIVVWLYGLGFLFLLIGGMFKI